MAAGAVEAVHESAPGGPDVRGFLHRPAGPVGAGLVLTHGAGSDCNGPLLVAVATALAARGVAVLRCDLPYRQARRQGPPRPGQSALDREGLERAASALGRAGARPVHLGGVSYGGRQASLLAAEKPDVAGALLLISYPLHPPGRAAQLRTAHFPALVVPTMFVHGTEDPFGSVPEMESARALIAGPTALLVIEGAGHGLGSRGRSARPSADVVDGVAGAFVDFAKEMAHAR